MNRSEKEPGAVPPTESQPTKPGPGTKKRREHKARTDTVQDYLPLFRAVVKAYLRCLDRAEGVDLDSPSSLTVATNRYVVDVDQAASEVLDTLALWFAWGDLVRREGGLGFYEDVPEDMERVIIATAGREWERLGLVAGSGVGTSKAMAVPRMQQGVERRSKFNQEVNAK